MSLKNMHSDLRKIIIFYKGITLELICDYCYSYLVELERKNTTFSLGVPHNKLAVAHNL